MAYAVGSSLRPPCGSKPTKRPVTSSREFAGVTYRGAIGTQPPKTVTDKTGGPIFQNLPELLPLGRILLPGPANSPVSDAPAKTLGDRTLPGLCSVTGRRCHPCRLYRLPRAGARSPAERRPVP